MKVLRLLFSSAFIFVSGFLSAQSLVLEESTIPYGDENYPAWVANMEEMDADFARKSFADFAKENLAIKMKKHHKSGMIGKEIRLNQVYPARRADLLADFQAQGNSVKVALSFVMGYDIILNSQDNPEEMNKFHELASDIVYDIYQDYYNKQIEDINKSIKDLQHEIKKNEKTKKKLSKSIDKNNKKMEASDEVEIAKLEAENIGSQSQITAADEMNVKLTEEMEKLEGDIKILREKAKKLSQEHQKLRTAK